MKCNFKQTSSYNMTNEFNETFENGSYIYNLSKQIRPSEDSLTLTYILIPLYIIIFVAAVLGNVLVIFTLVHNKRMRTVTNVFLLNLAISDLLLAVFCMPFTLIPIFMSNFIFGPTICVLIRYLQGVSVAVSCFTLVAISLERYFGICRPLRSRRWQTLSHSYKVIIICWILAAIVMIPVAVCTKHISLLNGKYKCDERWQSPILEKTYTVFLDLILLLCPFILMVVAYGCIISTLWDGIQAQAHQKELNGIMNGTKKSASLSRRGSEGGSFKYANYGSSVTSPDNGYCSAESTPRRVLEYRRVIRHSNPERNRAAKLKVIRMLLALCVEFFVCWTPLYTILTWKIFHFDSLRYHFSALSFTLFFVLSYISTMCNPITYCFMNQKFRQSFKMVLGCCKSRHVRRFSHSTSLKLNGTKLSLVRSKYQRKQSTTDKNLPSPGDEHSVLVVVGNSSDGVSV